MATNFAFIMKQYQITHIHSFFYLVSCSPKMFKPSMTFLAAIIFILHLNSELCSGANYGRYSCNNCIVGKNSPYLCRQCVSVVQGNSDAPFTCRRCSPGTELSNYNCKGCRNKNPEFGEKSVETELYLNIIQVTVEPPVLNVLTTLNGVMTPTQDVGGKIGSFVKDINL